MCYFFPRNCALKFLRNLQSPDYHIYPCIMRTNVSCAPMYHAHPILKPVLKRSVSMSFLTTISTNDFLEKYSSNLKSNSTSMKSNNMYKIWCKLFNVLSVQWYIKFCDVFFIFLLFYYCLIKCNPFAKHLQRPATSQCYCQWFLEKCAI